MSESAKLLVDKVQHYNTKAAPVVTHDQTASPSPLLLPASFQLPALTTTSSSHADRSSTVNEQPRDQMIGEGFPLLRASLLASAA